MNPTKPSERLAALGITLDPRPAALAWQRAVAEDDGVLYVSGQVPFTDDGVLHVGRLEDEGDIEIGRQCARLCAIHVLAQLDAAVGSLEHVRLVKLNVFVASAPGFSFQSDVAHGASDLLYDVLGMAGKHARTAIGVAALPLGVPVEVEAIARIGK